MRAQAQGVAISSSRSQGSLAETRDGPVPLGRPLTASSPCRRVLMLAVEEGGPPGEHRRVWGESGQALPVGVARFRDPTLYQAITREPAVRDAGLREFGGPGSPGPAEAQTEKWEPSGP